MGLFTGLIGLSVLKQRQLDIEYKIQDIMITINQVSSNAVDLVTIGNDLDPDSPEFKTLNTRREKLQLMEKRLQTELVRYQTLLKMVNGQADIAQKFIDASIKRLTNFGGAIQ